ncbi:glutathione S-transferase U9 [Ricinus communis]|uniref:Glutathione S-transferase n=1 Tax=Ricinus communis TaxID=3988 RepID=B9R999_RICCO|nr:glutathione S-transferase U9 [Ricinus communis]EEF52176.1 glutathione s-transferase, putative [Ricinus communis]|eukprot:XP_002511574.1 glutathione S-transferase U9 [Ricinus communis]
MGEENKVTLHGTWGSPFTKRVELALKLKGITFNYVEEDLRNKSQLLLHYNPVHKKVPVLVHNGRPIAESFVIIEYIDETWKSGPKLLPEDPYGRAKVRFWANYIQQKLFDTMFLVITTNGEAQDKAGKEVMENLKVLENGMKDFLQDGIPTINSENVGLVDIIMCSLFSPHKAQEEVLGVKIIDPDKTPLIFSWITSINELPAVKEITPPHEKLVELLQFLRQKYGQPSTA